MKKTIFIFLGILIIVGLVGGGYYLWQNQAKYPLVTDLIKKTGLNLNKEPQWDVLPNYASPTGVVQDGDVYWIGSWGGVLRYDEKTKEMRFYNKSNGLLGNQVWSMTRVDDKIWFTIQGSAWSGDRAAGAGIQAIDIKSGDIVKTFPAISIVSPGIIDIFSPFGNPEIFQDPYNKSLWVATLRGLYAYNERTDKWDDIGEAVNSLYDIYDLAFTQKEVFARTADSELLYLDKSARLISGVSDEGNGVDFLVSNSESAFVAGRPSDYGSCGDIDKKESIVEKYTAGSGWDKMDVLNGAIDYDEVVKSLVIKDGQLWVYTLTNDCGGGVGEKQFFILKYDTTKDEVIGRVRDAEDDKYMNTYSNLDQAKQEDYSGIAQKIEKETGILAEKSVVFIDKNNRILIRSGDIMQKGAGYAYFDPQNNTYDFSLWDKIIAHKEVSESDFSFELMPCNQYNDSDKEDLVFIHEYYVGMGGPSEEAVYAYNKKNDSLEKYVFEAFDQSKNYYQSLSGTLICNSKELVYPSNQGMASLDWAKKQETVYSENYKPIISVNDNEAPKDNMNFFDGSKRYFLAEGAKIGYFDVNLKRYFYDYQIPQDLSDAQGISYNFSDHVNWFENMMLTAVDNDKMYFYLNDASLDNNLPPRKRAVIVFDTKLNLWNVYLLDEKLSSATDHISDVKFWNGKIWVTLGEAVTITIDTANGNQAIVGSKDGMLDEYGTILPHGNSIWFSGPGIWGLVK